MEVHEPDALDNAMDEVETARVAKAEIWERTGGDYYGAEYQAAQDRYDLAVTKYNEIVRRGQPWRNR